MSEEPPAAGVTEQYISNTISPIEVNESAPVVMQSFAAPQQNLEVYYVPTVDAVDRPAVAGAFLPEFLTSLKGQKIFSAEETAEIYVEHAMNPLLAGLSTLRLLQKKGAVLEGGVLQPDQERFPGTRPTTFRPLRLSAMCGTHQREIADFLVSGFKNGFQIMYEGERKSATHGNPPCKDQAEYDAMSKGIATDVEKGYTAKVSNAILATFAFLILSPIFAIMKKLFGVNLNKYRRIHNLSATDHAHDVEASVNDGIDSDKTSMSYTTVAAACSVVRQEGRGAHFVQDDLEDAFRILPMAESDYGLLGFMFASETYVETRAVFGCRSSPILYGSLTALLAWLLYAVFGVRNVSAYLDDFLAVTSAVENAPTAELMALFFLFLGLPRNLLKHKSGLQIATYLGILIDAARQTVALPAERLVALKAILSGWLEKESATEHELASLLGSLVFVCRVIPQGRIFLSRLFASLIWTHHHPHQRAKLGDEARKDLTWWISFLDVFNNECPLFGAADLLRMPTIEFWTDASDFGGGGFLNGQWWQVLWTTEFAKLPIAVRELYAVVCAFLTWGHLFRGQHVLAHCDNTNSIFAIRKMKSNAASGWVQHLLRVLTMHAAMHGYTFRIEYIASLDNVIADMISRKPLEELKEYFVSIPGASLTPQAVCRPPEVTDPTWEASMSSALKQELLAQAEETNSKSAMEL